MNSGVPARTFDSGETTVAQSDLLGELMTVSILPLGVPLACTTSPGTCISDAYISLHASHRLCSVKGTFVDMLGKVFYKRYGAVAEGAAW